MQLEESFRLVVILYFGQIWTSDVKIGLSARFEGNWWLFDHLSDRDDLL